MSFTLLLQNQHKSLRKKWVPLFENEQFLLVRGFFCCAGTLRP
jgi:hypothetical protein